MTYSAKVTNLRRVMNNLSIEEPHLTKIAYVLYKALQARRDPIPDPRHPSIHLKGYTPKDIKTILLQLHRDALPLLSTETFDIIVDSKDILPDPKIPYSGVYIGSYLHEDGSCPSVRDIVRITNVLLNGEELTEVIEPLVLGGKTEEAVERVGTCWKESLGELGLWRTISEFGKRGRTVSYDEDDEEQIEVRGEGAVPLELRYPKFSIPFPFTPYYVGYGKKPSHRWTAHRRGMYSEDCIDISRAWPK